MSKTLLGTGATVMTESLVLRLLTVGEGRTAIKINLI